MRGLSIGIVLKFITCTSTRLYLRTKQNKGRQIDFISVYIIKNVLIKDSLQTLLQIKSVVLGRPKSYYLYVLRHRFGYPSIFLNYISEILFICMYINDLLRQCRHYVGQYLNICSTSMRYGIQIQLYGNIYLCTALALMGHS